MSHATLTGNWLEDSRGTLELGPFQRIKTTQVSAFSPPPPEKPLMAALNYLPGALSLNYL